MIYGIGVDVMNLKRIYPLSSNLEDPFFVKTFTENERMEGALREDPIKYFGERFSGKEAVFKSLRISSDAIRLNEIEILNDSENKPYVNLLGRARQLSMELGVVEVSVSLSNDDKLVVSFAISECVI